MPRFVRLGQMLGEVSSIVAIAGDSSLIVSNCVEEGLDDGTIIEAQSSDSVCGDVVNNAMLIDAGVEVGNVLSTHLDESIFLATSLGSFCRSRDAPARRVLDSKATYRGNLVLERLVRCARKSLSIPN